MSKLIFLYILRVASYLKYLNLIKIEIDVQIVTFSIIFIFYDLINYFNVTNLTNDNARNSRNL